MNAEFENPVVKESLFLARETLTKSIIGKRDRDGSFAVIYISRLLRFHQI